MFIQCSHILYTDYRASKFRCLIYLVKSQFVTVFWKTDHVDTKTEIHLLPVRDIYSRAGRYTAEKSKRRYFCHTGIDIEQKILYRQTDIRTVRIPVYRKNTDIP